MDQFSVGKLLPNLTVTLGNEDSLEEGEEPTDVVDPPVMSSIVQVVRPNIEPVSNPKVYLNKDGGFATGIDLIAEENSGILDRRAERFGLEKNESKETISSLYESMGIDIQNMNTAKMRNIRLEALHLRGLEDLSSEDLFDYFKEYPAFLIEWINDSCCNVIWTDVQTPARALLGLSKPLPDSISSEHIDAEEKAERENLEKELKEEAQEGSEKTFESTSYKEGDGIENTKLATDVNNDEENEDMDVDAPADEETISIDIPVPPGKWRFGVPHPKAKDILIRFATKADKKIKGAEKRSKYYQKYGNPNYGGMKGIISSSKKQKIQAAANRRVIEKTSSSFKSSFSAPKSDSSPAVPRPKAFRMRMYADDEELKAKHRRLNIGTHAMKGSVHSRLGVKYTSEDLLKLGPYKRSYRNISDNEDDSGYKHSSVDLRSKISGYKNRGTLRSDQREFSRRNVERYSKENTDRDFTVKRSLPSAIVSYKHVEDLKRDRKTYYKRKHRSPLCAEDDDEEEEETSSSDY